jgi:hypothetical protein
VPSHCYRMRVFDRDLIRGGHYGQRSSEPHRKAEHMAAPTNAVKREKSSCQHGAVHTWQIVLRKSFWGGERNFLGPLMRFACDDMRDHIVTHKNDHGRS